MVVGGGIVGSATAYFLSTDGTFQGRRIVFVALGRGAAPSVLHAREYLRRNVI